MASILVIGVGTTGLNVLERAQQYYYEFTKKESPDNAAFMFLETAVANPICTPNGKTKIQTCHIFTDNVEATLGPWRMEKKYDWLPSDADVLNAHDGAANQPAVGRVALWANETVVTEKIRTLYEELHGNNETNIYVVGSLTGGTGTGVFIDLAYMIRKITGNNHIYGMFLLPSRHDVGTEGKDILYENAYSSLKTLDHYSVTKEKKGVETVAFNYKCILPTGNDISNPNTPFEDAQFFSQDFCNNDASLDNLKQLVQTVGFNLVLRMLDVNHMAAPVQNVVNSKKVDYFTSVHQGLYTTIGMNVFQYPEALLEEYFTTSLIEKNILHRWVDAVNYIDKHGQPSSLQSLKSILKVEANKFIQEELEAAIESCKGNPMLGKPSFYSVVEEEITTIINGDYQVPKENYLYGLFSSESQAPKLYAAISGYAMHLRSRLIESIAKKVSDESTRLQNFAALEILIVEIINALEKVLKDLKVRYKLDGTTSQWNNVWQDLFKDRLSSGQIMYKISGCQAEFYAEAIEGAATLCFYNTFIPMIEDVLASMQNKNGQKAIMTPSGVELPTLETLSILRGKVNILLNPQINNSLVARQASIYTQLTNDSNRQFIFLFNGKDCEEDIKVAHGIYESQPEWLDFSRITKDSMWAFLLKYDVNNLKSLMIAQGLEFIQSKCLFANTDIVKIMTNLPQTHRSYKKVHNLLAEASQIIAKDAPSMVKLVNSEQFHSHDSLKLIVMSNQAEDSRDGIVAHMTEYQPSREQRNYVMLPSLKNTVVVYQEYGYLGSINGVAKAFNPLIHICYQNQVREMICQKIKNKSFDEAMRLAYIDVKTLQDIDNVKIS